MIYCGNNAEHHSLLDGSATLGTRYQCLRKGIGKGKSLPVDLDYLGSYSPIDNEKIYCGNNDNLPDGYDRFGNTTSCMQKGIGIGKKISAESSENSNDNDGDEDNKYNFDNDYKYSFKHKDSNIKDGDTNNNIENINNQHAILFMISVYFTYSLLLFIVLYYSNIRYFKNRLTGKIRKVRFMLFYLFFFFLFVLISQKLIF